MIDTHAHLDFVDDLEGVVGRAKEAGVTKIVTIGTSIESSKKCIEVAEKYSNFEISIYATCGIHPEDGKADIDKYGNDLIDELRKVVTSSKKVVGIGECGLDFHLGADSRPITNAEEKEFQRKLFGEQIKLSVELNLPLVVHCRNAWGEVFDQIQGTTLRRAQGRTLNLGTLKPSGSRSDPVELDSGSDLDKVKGIFHSWTGDIEAMKKAIDIGFYISFSGIVTFKNAPDIQEVVKRAPIDKILVETDSPFLAPHPLRREKNEPKNVKIVADFIASLRGLSLGEIMDITSRNAAEVFKI